MCFVAMPFGRKAPPGKEEPIVDFDRVFSFIAEAIEAEGLEPIRADFEPGGGFIHKPMYERLLVAEYVVADLTFSNANVTYEVGVRHGASNRPTILVGASEFMDELPFDFKPLRVMPYKLQSDGSMSDEDGASLQAGLRGQLRDAIAGRLGVDNPIMQVTSWAGGGRLEHDKTDVFLARTDYAGDVGERIRAALALRDADKAAGSLRELELQLLDGTEVVTQLHSALIAIYLGYRKHEAWQAMVDMFSTMPRELQVTPMAREQLALALNRLAERASKIAAVHRQARDADAAEVARAESEKLRSQAIEAADLPEELVTAETWGIRGRIYKGWHGSELAAGNTLKAEAALKRAIETYEAGTAADMRDYYPGVNAVTLRLFRSGPDDAAALEDLIPVVRMAADVAPPPQSTDEQYWRAATKMELASAAKDFESARTHLLDMLGYDVDDWMHETTINNLRIHQAAFSGDDGAVNSIRELIAELGP